MNLWKTVSFGALTLLMTGAGIMHFVSPEGFVRIVPPFLPWPRAIVAVSGVFEILGGLGLLWPSSRPYAAWGLVALLISVFPANIYMAIADLRPRGIPAWTLWARLPLQPALVFWAWTFTR